MRDQSSILYITENADTIFRKLRWGDSVHCPYCGHTHIYTLRMDPTSVPIVTSIFLISLTLYSMHHT